MSDFSNTFDPKERYSHWSNFSKLPPYEEFISKMKDNAYAQSVYSDIAKRKGELFTKNIGFNEWYGQFGLNAPQPSTAGQVQSSITQLPQDNTGITNVSETQLAQGGGDPPVLIPSTWGTNPKYSQPTWTPTEDQLNTLQQLTNPLAPDLTQQENIPVQGFNSPQEEMDYIRLNTTPQQRQFAYIFKSAFNNSALGLALKAASPDESPDVFMAGYNPTFGEQIAGQIGSLFLDLPLFGVGGKMAKGTTNVLINSLSKQALKEGVTRQALADAAKVVLNPTVGQRLMLTMSESAGALGVYDAMKNVLTQVADPEKDIKDIDTGEVLRSFVEGNALGAMVGVLGFGTKVAQSAIKAKMGTSALSKATQAGTWTGGFAAENLAFVYGGALLEGRPMNNVGWKDLASSALVLGAMKVPHMFSKSPNFTEEKIGKDEHELVLNNAENEILGVNSPEEAIEKYKDKDELRRVFEDEKIPQITKAKLAWALEGVRPSYPIIPSDVKVNGSYVTLTNKEGEVVYKEKYEDKDEAEANAINYASVLADRDKRIAAATIPLQDRVGIINDFKGSGGDVELLQSASDKSFEPWNRTTEETKTLSKFDDLVEKYWVEKNKPETPSKKKPKPQTPKQTEPNETPIETTEAEGQKAEPVDEILGILEGQKVAEELVAEKIEPIKVKQYSEGEGGTKGIFEGEDGKLYKSTQPQEIVQTEKGFERKSIEGKETDEYKLLSELQDNPNVPKIGKLIETSEGKAFEIEKLNEVDEFTIDEYKQIRDILNGLNDKGYHVGDKVTVMKRPQTGELVIVDFSEGYKQESGESSSRDVNYLSDIEKKVDVNDLMTYNYEQRAIEANKVKESTGKNIKVQGYRYKMRMRPFSKGAFPEDGFVKVIAEGNKKKDGFYNIIEYSKPLSAGEVKRYELEFDKRSEEKYSFKETLPDTGVVEAKKKSPTREVVESETTSKEEVLVGKKRLSKKDFNLNDRVLNGLEQDNSSAIGFLNEYPENFIGIEISDEGANKITGLKNNGEARIEKINDFSVQLNFKNNRTKVIHFSSEEAMHEGIDKIYKFTENRIKSNPSTEPPASQKSEILIDLDNHMKLKGKEFREYEKQMVEKHGENYLKLKAITKNFNEIVRTLEEKIPETFKKICP